MKIQELRRILLAASEMYAKAGAREPQEALKSLADLLKPFDKDRVDEFVARVAKLTKQRTR